jgi:hypothetical protein
MIFYSIYFIIKYNIELIFANTSIIEYLFFSDVEYFIPRIAPPVSILLLLYIKKNFIIKYVFLIFILMMTPNSHHLIQISIVEEYHIFRTINLDKNDDFVHSTKNAYFYFAVCFFSTRYIFYSIYFIIKYNIELIFDNTSIIE